MLPTNEQIKELWEWCGLRRGNKGINKNYYTEPDARYYTIPVWKLKLDLNNLFKYAVPKLPVEAKIGFYYYGENAGADKYFAFIGKGDNLYKDAWSEEPALALFWAIYKLIKGK